mmetsp:Transcript_9999/g.21999  ORF Transcript_9999/g.21999 Transcript_9999/m.21999 type:complete len:315 (-) Transcript_9999:247-1191(-)
MGGKGSGKPKAVWKVKDPVPEPEETPAPTEKGKSGGKGKGKGKTDGEGGEVEEKKFTVDSRPYGEALHELYKGTAARAADFDAKTIQLMDALHDAGKTDAAIKHMLKALTGVAREKVTNWSGYLFALLRGFDKEIYEQARSQRGKPERSRKDREKKLAASIKTSLKATAPEFVPGQFWGGLPMMMPMGMPWGAATQEAAPQPAAVSKGNSGGSPKLAPSEPTVFQVECKTEEGQSVFVVGGHEELGEWKPEGARPLNSSGTFPIWKSVGLKLGKEEFEYKFIIKKGEEVTWEPIEGNRKATAGKELEVVKFGEL